TGLDLAEEAFMRLDPDEEIEPASRVGVVALVIQHERGSAAGVNVPRIRGGEVIGQLEIEAGDGEVVADADLDVRTERDVLDERLGLVMPAEHKLIGIDGHADAWSKRLRSGGSCGQEEECGQRTGGQQYSAK